MDIQNADISPVLKSNLHYLPDQRDGIIIDLGAGEGDDICFLAHLGYSCMAYDSNPECVRSLAAKVKTINLSLEVIESDIREINFDCLQSAVILSVNVFNFLPFEDTQKIFSRMENGLKDNGIIMLQAFAHGHTMTQSTPAVEHLFQPLEFNTLFKKLTTLNAGYYIKNVDHKCSVPVYRSSVVYCGKKKPLET